MSISFLQHETSRVKVGTENKDLATITRGGKGCTLINLSFFEVDSTFRRFNEVFKLLLEPVLDHIFRNKESGCLKSKFAFVVDNGPGEAPSSPTVKMLLVRLLKYLDLDMVAQISFAEYHSKMNFVERVHATENECLSRHGPFSSRAIHKEFNVGDEKHRINMEAMAEEVISCIQQGQFSGKKISCFRGVLDEQCIFDDEEKLKRFFLLSEEAKKECDWEYETRDVKLHNDMKLTWGVKSMKRK